MNAWEKYCSLERPRVVGLMSGTSIDALDAVLVEIDVAAMERELGGRGVPQGLEPPRLIRMTSTPLGAELKARLHRVFADEGRPSDLTYLHWYLGRLFAEAALSVGEPAGTSQGIDLVASHGQTVFHGPHEVVFLDGKSRGTWQMGEGALIAELVGVPVVCDFRCQDLARGGQGAPLVPFADSLLFGHLNMDRVALNVGGMANITWIPARNRHAQVQACDTGPGNVLSDALVYLGTGGERSFDEDGRLAAEGRVVPDLLKEMMNHPYMHKPLPKSTGREEFGMAMARELLGRGPLPDMVRTALAFTAQSIAHHIALLAQARAEALAPLEILIGGGGARNPVLMAELRQRLPRYATMLSMDVVGVPVQAREAMAFALMAHETMHGRASNVPGATGASAHVVQGKIVLP